MSRIGVLGEANTVTVGTTTVYIVPTGRAAKIKIMHLGIAQLNTAFALWVNGIKIMQSAAMAAGNASHSNSTQMHAAAATAASLTGASDTTTVAPGPKEYQLSAGDTVQYTVVTADFTSLSVQVIGAEVEVS